VQKSRKFVNPLTQRSDTLPATLPSTDTSIETSTLPATVTPTLSSTFTSTLPQIVHRKRGAQAFEKTHERITLWIDRGLKQQFETLAEEQGVAKTTLLNEAINDLLKKYQT